MPKTQRKARRETPTQELRPKKSSNNSIPSTCRDDGWGESHFKIKIILKTAFYQGFD